MKLIKTLLTILFISLLSSPSWSVTFGDLVERDGLYYEKFTDVPFNGQVTGVEQGSFKSGKREGAWIDYWDNGQLWHKGEYKKGKKEGAWVRYHKSGQLNTNVNYKNGMKEGTLVSYHGNGQLRLKGNYKNDEREGAWVGYHDNGWGMFKGNYISGNQEGDWVGYNKDGTVNKELTGTFKNGKKISD